MDKKQLITHIKEFIKLEDFKALDKGADAVSLVRENEIFKDEIIFTYKKSQGGYILSHKLNGRKSFFAINLILKKYFDKIGKHYQEHTLSFQSRSFDHIFNEIFFETKDLVKIENDYKTMVHDDLIPFFNRYKTLEDVNTYMLEFTSEEVTRLVSSPIKIMVLKRLINASDWVEYSEKTIETYRVNSKRRNKAIFAPVSSILPDLYDELQSLNI